MLHNNIFSEFERKIHQKTKKLIDPYFIPDLQNIIMEYAKNDMPMPQKNFIEALLTADQHAIEMWQDLGALMIGIDTSLPHGGPLPQALWDGDYTKIKKWHKNGANFVGLDVMACREGRWSVPYEALVVENFKLFHSLLNGVGSWDKTLKTRGAIKNLIGAECTILQFFLVTFKDYLRRYPENTKMTDEIFYLLLKKPKALQIPEKSKYRTGPLTLTLPHYDYIKLLLENTHHRSFSEDDMVNAMEKSMHGHENIILLLLENKISTKNLAANKLFFRLPKLDQETREKVLSLFLENGFEISNHPTIVQDAINKRQPDDVIKTLFSACQKNNIDLLSRENNYQHSVVDFAKFKGRVQIAEWMQEQLTPPIASRRMGFR